MATRSSALGVGVRVLVGVLVLGACATPTTRPEPSSGSPWLELRSPHFTLHTDVSRDAADAALRRLEVRHAALVHLYDQLLPPRDSSPSRNTQIIVFAGCGDMPRPQRGVNGYVATGMDFLDQQRVITCGDSLHAEEIMLHELAHILNVQRVGRMPVWLNEGLARYSQSLAVSGTEVAAGELRGGVSAYLDKHPNPLSLDELFAADRATFYDRARAPGFYHAAHNLVHVLVSASDEHRRRFAAYLGRLAAGEERGAAWTAAMEGLAMPALEAQMRRRHLDPTRRLWRLTIPPAAEVAVTARPLGAGETAALRVSLLLVDRTSPPAASLALLDDAARRDPTWPDGALWRALVELASPAPDHAAALRLLRAHLARRPGDERALSAVLAAETPDGDYANELTADPQSLARLDGDAQQLAAAARSAAALNNAAWFHAQRRRPEAGLPLAERAVAADPSNPLYQDTLAALLFQSGRVAEARSLQERAVQALAERATPPMLRRLEQYRRP